MVDGVFAARGLKRLDSWYVLEIAIDPDCEGKGARVPLPLVHFVVGRRYFVLKKNLSLSLFFFYKFATGG